MNTNRQRAYLGGVIVLVILLVSFLYAYAAFVTDPSHVFGGFLINPTDGNSYLAKMRQGWEGGWTFTLPYTAEPGDGAYLFLFYLVLGHLARLFDWSLLLTLHLTRLLGTIALLLSLYRFCAALIPQDRGRWLAFVLAAFGSGSGWLALFFGAFTIDLWVAEAYPFLSSYTNAHFPFGLALQLYLLTPDDEPASWHALVKLSVAALLLAIIAPFGVPVVVAVQAGLVIWKVWRGDVFKAELSRLLVILLASGPILAYDFWVVSTNAQLSGWNAQNVTPSPPLWDLIIALSPAFLVALPGAWFVWKEGSARRRALLVWIVLGMVMLYLPWSLQRRFLSGLFVPVACLAALGLSWLIDKQGKNFRRWAVGLVVASLLTNLVVMSSAFFGIKTQSPEIVLTRGERRAFEWIEENAPKRSLFLVAPDTGLLIPAYTHGRVLYGHPFETVNADAQRETVEAFFSGGFSTEEMDALVVARDVDYIFIGPRERALGEVHLFDNWRVAYAAEGVMIYQVEKD